MRVGAVFYQRTHSVCVRKTTLKSVTISCNIYVAISMLHLICNSVHSLFLVCTYPLDKVSRLDRFTAGSKNTHTEKRFETSFRVAAYRHREQQHQSPCHPPTPDANHRHLNWVAMIKSRTNRTRGAAPRPVELEWLQYLTMERLCRGSRRQQHGGAVRS